MSSSSSSIVLTVLLFASAFVSPVPLPSTRKADGLSEAFVDCSDLYLVRRLQDYRIPFRCVEGSLWVAFDEEPSANDVITLSDKLAAVDDRITIVENDDGNLAFVVEEPRRFAVADDCVDPLTCDRDSQSDSGESDLEVFFGKAPPSGACPKGFTFVASVGGCVSAIPEGVDAQPETTVFVSDGSAPSACPEGYSFSLTKGECEPQKERVAPAAADAAPLDHNDAFAFDASCDSGTIFVPEVGICLPVGPPAPPEPQATPPDPVAFDASSAECPSGTVYNSEIDMCTTVENGGSRTPLQQEEAPQETQQEEAPQETQQEEAPQEPQQETKQEIEQQEAPQESQQDEVPQETKQELAHQEAPQAMSLIKSRQSAVAMETALPKDKGKNRCDEGMVYNSEIDLCTAVDMGRPLPATANGLGERPQADAAAAPASGGLGDWEVVSLNGTTEDPFRLTLAPLTEDQIGRSKCRDDEVYVSEIDLCLEMPRRPTKT